MIPKPLMLAGWLEAATQRFVAECPHLAGLVSLDFVRAQIWASATVLASIYAPAPAYDEINWIAPKGDA